MIFTKFCLIIYYFSFENINTCSTLKVVIIDKILIYNQELDFYKEKNRIVWDREKQQMQRQR